MSLSPSRVERHPSPTAAPAPRGPGRRPGASSRPPAGCPTRGSRRTRLGTRGRPAGRRRRRVLDQRHPPPPLRLGDRQPEVVAQHRRVAAVVLGVRRRAAEDLAQPGRHALRVVGRHPGEERSDQLVLADQLVEAFTQRLQGGGPTGPVEQAGRLGVDCPRWSWTDDACCERPRSQNATCRASSPSPEPRPDTSRPNSTACSELVATVTGRPLATGGTGEPQRVRPTVPLGPLRHQVGDDRPVVVRRRHERAAGRPCRVDTVHPDVAGEDDVGEEAERPHLPGGTDLLLTRHRAATDEPGHALTSANGPGHGLGEAVHHGRRVEARPASTCTALSASTSSPPRLRAARSWRTCSRSDADIWTMPRTWVAIAWTSQSGQSVGATHCPGETSCSRLR